jgi:RNA polymerase sigma factor (sigma-70 family)
VRDPDQGFTRTYTRYYPRVLAYARRRVAPDQALEATDETFLIAWRRRDELPAALLPWLLVTARNVLSQQWRAGQRQDAIAAELTRQAGASAYPGADAFVLERVAVLSALARLTEADREALMLTSWDGLSNRQAAVVLECSTAAFGVRLHRARRRLAAALEEFDDEHEDQRTAPRPTEPRRTERLAQPRIAPDHT